VIEADIESFFDTIEHSHLRSFLDQRIRDGVVRKAIDKWLRAGVLEEGQIHSVQNGTPQGGVISPLLANLYLHKVLDQWFERDVYPRTRKRAQLIRYADDFVLLFGWEEDAKRVNEVLPKRFARYGLKLHPEKTRLIGFSSPHTKRGRKVQIKPGTFDFLGFTHYWAKSRKGNHVVKQKTSKARFSRSLKRIKEQCRRMMHDTLPKQQRILSRMLTGHYNYFGITGNSDALRNFRHEVDWIWGRALARRNKRRFAWRRFLPILRRFPLPPARTVHSVCPSEFRV
jgi:group II intron reverse transcriptase/maturase